MDLKQFKQRLLDIQDPAFCYKIGKEYIDSFYVNILYFMAMETNIDTSHTRSLWVEAMNQISTDINKIVPLPDYDIWSRYSFKNASTLKESDDVQVIFGKDGLKVSSSDEVFINQNYNVAKPKKRYSKRVNSLLEKRKREYKGILGNDYVSFYVDKLLNEIQLVLKGVGNSELSILKEILENYVKRVKLYIEKGT